MDVQGGDEPSSRIIVCDINAEMLQEGRRRAKEKGYSQGETWLSGSAPSSSSSATGGIIVEFVQGDAECLPFADRRCVPRHLSTPLPSRWAHPSTRGVAVVCGMGGPG